MLARGRVSSLHGPLPQGAQGGRPSRLWQASRPVGCCPAVRLAAGTADTAVVQPVLPPPLRLSSYARCSNCAIAPLVHVALWGRHLQERRLAPAPCLFPLPRLSWQDSPALTATTDDIHQATIPRRRGHDAQGQIIRRTCETDHPGHRGVSYEDSRLIGGAGLTLGLLLRPLERHTRTALR